MPERQSTAGEGAAAEPSDGESRQVVIAPRSLFILVIIFLGGVLLLATVYAAREIVIQLCAAIIFAMALEPIVQALQRQGLSRGRAVGLTFALTVLGTMTFAYVLVPPLVEEVTRFAQHLPDLLQRLARDYHRLGSLDRRFSVVASIRTWMTEQGGAALIGQPALRFVREALHTVTAVVTVAFLSLFVGLNGREWFDGFLNVVPAASRERWSRVGAGVSTAVGGYVFGNVLISLIAGTVTTVVLLATGVPYPVPLGLVVGLFDLIPMVGASLGMVIVAAVALTKGIGTVAIVVAAMVLYQEIENHTLTQLVYHRTVKLSALAIAVSVAAGAEIGGIVGALFAIPIAGALKVVARELVAWQRGEDPPEEPAPPKPPRWVVPWRRRTDAAA